MMDDLARILLNAGAPILGGLVKELPGGQVASVIIEQLAKAYGTTPTADAVGAAVQKDPATAKTVEASAAPDLMPLFLAEAKRTSDAQAAEIERGFTAWQIMRVVIQIVVWGGWTVILAVALFGGNIGSKPLMGVGDVVTAWGGVTWVWMIVFNGGHTLKEVAPTLLSAFRKA